MVFLLLSENVTVNPLMSLERKGGGAHSGRSGSPLASLRSRSPHTGILIRLEPLGETVHPDRSALSVPSPGCYPESSLRAAGLLVAARSAEWKSLKANTSIFVLSVSLELDSSFSLSRASPPSFPVSISLFFPANVSTLIQHYHLQSRCGDGCQLHFSVLLQVLLKGVLCLCSRHMQTCVLCTWLLGSLGLLIVF